tara:strand:- start:471 stop:671 length:201 start_codon:yes stop_codon:yes gene_type:complete
VEIDRYNSSLYDGDNCHQHRIAEMDGSDMTLLGLFFIGIPFSVVVLWGITKWIQISDRDRLERDDE